MSLRASRECCTIIAENIEQLAQNAGRLLTLDEEPMGRRIAWILTVHAIDEAGKLIMMMKESVAAESSKSKEVRIGRHRSHAAKGSEAGTAGLQALNMFEEVITRLVQDVMKGGFDIQRYRNHLEAVRTNFSGERSGALYAVFADGQCLPPTCPHEKDIYVDAWILNLMATIVKINLKHGKSFEDVDKIVRKIMNSSRVLMAEWEKGFGSGQSSVD
jgi:AbiV family abortive infection protein